LKRFTIRSLVPLPGFVKLGESTSAAGGLPCELLGLYGQFKVKLRLNKVELQLCTQIAII
jgi:hypothetical protein